MSAIKIGIWNFSRFTLLTMVSFILISVSLREVSQWVVTHQRAIPEATGVHVLEAVSIGGIRQWIEIRGTDRNNPVLLLLHGGPGRSSMAAFSSLQREWEKHFLVVQWDQRGAGFTLLKNDQHLLKNTLSLERMQSDTIEVVNYLRRKFNKQKIFVMGSSWGSILGLRLAKEHSQWIHAYIGTGQIINLSKSLTESYKFALSRAVESGNERAILELRTVMASSGNTVTKPVAALNTIHRWVTEYGGAVTSDNALLELVISSLTYPHYSLLDLYSLYFSPPDWVNDTLMPKVMSLDLQQLGLRYRVPIFFFHGRHDLIVPGSLAEAYLEKIVAPHKKFVWLENAGHAAPAEEFEHFTSLLLEQVLPCATDRNCAGN